VGLLVHPWCTPVGAVYAAIWLCTCTKLHQAQQRPVLFLLWEGRWVDEAVLTHQFASKGGCLQRTAACDVCLRTQDSRR
jgi:hypothetical protein